MLRSTLPALIAAVGLGMPLVAGSPGPAAPVDRTVFVTVTDGKGVPVTDMTPADFVVKEGGKERQVLKAEPATARMKVALAVEERIVGIGAIRLALFEFAKRVTSNADVSLITIGLSNRTIVDYTSNLQPMVDAINKFTMSPGRDSNVGEGVLEMAAKFSAAKTERPVIVVVCLSGGQAGADARPVLDKLRESGATMYTVTLVGGAQAADSQQDDANDREQILSEGPKQSGGRQQDVNLGTAVPQALQQVANELLGQYAVTYTLPDGVKMERRFNITTKKRGVTVRGPSLIPDR
jgi:hypothetical protein